MQQVYVAQRREIKTNQLEVEIILYKYFYKQKLRYEYLKNLRNE